MITRRTFVLATATAALVAAGALVAPAAFAQDIEMQARLSGRPLPSAYYERVARDPLAFEFRRAWTRRAAAEQAVVGSANPLRLVLPQSGNLRMVVVMTLFSDSPAPPFATSVVDGQLFGANPLGNLTQYYAEVSGRRVNLTGTVLPWVRTAVTRATAVGSTDGLGGNANMGAYLRSALTRVDTATNFGLFDNDGADGLPNSGDDDGYVDVTVFQFTEIAASCGGNGVWPHRSSVRGWGGGPFVTNDLRPNGQRVMVDDYIIQSVLDCDGQPQNIATIAHETGHAFGLPDYYDATGGLLPQQRRWVLGCWSLMAAGSWGCGDGSTFGKVTAPPHMGAYEKLALGWAGQTQTAPGWRREYVLNPVQTGAQLLQVPLRGSDEFLLLEYRPRTGFDAALPAAGVLMYHIEPDRALRPCATCPRLYRVSLVEADGDAALIRTSQEGGNRGVAGDEFSGTRTLDDGTTPNIRLNAGGVSNVRVEMTVAGGLARVWVSTVPDVALDRLTGPFLQTGAAPSADELAALDGFGNRNGRFDVGDLRAHVMRTPAVLGGTSR